MQETSEQVVYFLKSTTEPHLKIGIAKNPYLRAKAFEDSINFGASYYVDCEKHSARAIERTLHLLFHQYQVLKPVAEGYTEWFLEDCWSELRDFIAANQDKLGCSELKLIPPPENREAQAKSQRVPKKIWTAEEM